jgi:RNA polymerase sigma-70 factor (ECF subfamily)
MSEEADPLADWLADARAGSPHALGQALQACRGYLLLIAEKELDADLRAKGGASDLVQETFVKAHRHFDRFHGDNGGELRAWLRRLLLNHLADFRSLYREAAKRQAGREVPLQGSDSSAGGPAVADAGPSPSYLAMAQEQAEAVRRLLDRLPEDYRQVLQMRYTEGKSFEEIGRRMDRTANAVRKLWARAVERLQHEWDAEQAGGPDSSGR